MNTLLPVAAVPVMVAPAATGSPHVPDSPRTPEPESPPPDAAELQQAADELNRHFSTLRTDLKFSIDKDLNRIVVVVVDAQDGTVLRQIPGEDALRIARMLRDAANPPQHLIEASA